VPSEPEINSMELVMFFHTKLTTSTYTRGSRVKDRPGFHLPFYSEEYFKRCDDKGQEIYYPALDSPGVLHSLSGEPHVAARNQSRCGILPEFKILDRFII
jgi:hypothetical protein